MAERWTRQRRLEHTRSLLLDAAGEVFVKQGYGGAALEDIAELAGYTRGAIYSHFGTKEELFLAVIERHLQRFLDSFEDVIGAFDSLDDLDVEMFSQRWRDHQSGNGIDGAALNYEFSLFLLRNPDARERLAAKRLETVRLLTDYINEHVARLNGELKIPAVTLARILLACNEGITISGHLDGDDLSQAFLEMVVANVSPKAPTAKRSRQRRSS